MKIALIGGAAAVLCASVLPFVTLAQDAADWISGFPREPVPVVAWPADRKVAVSFALFVEEFGFGQGPVFRPDLASRSPDLVNEAFRQYSIEWGNARVGRLFKEMDVPLTIVLNAEFPGRHPSVWKEFRAIQPNAPIIAHGMNNTNRMLPLGRGLAAQKAYIRETLDLLLRSATVSAQEMTDAVTSDHDTSPEAWSQEGPAQGRRNSEF